VFGDSARILGREERRGGSDIIDLCPVIRYASTVFRAPYSDPAGAQCCLHLSVKRAISGINAETASVPINPYFFLG
jgi:hypothetical protein